MVMTYVIKFFSSLGLSENISYNLACLCLLILIILLGLIAKFICEKIFIKFLHSVISHTVNMWDDVFVENGVTNRIALIIPAVVIYYFTTLLFSAKSTGLIKFIHLVCLIYLITMCVIIADSILNSIVQIYEKYEMASRTPVKSFIQMLKVIIVLVAIIIVVSLLMQKSPWTLLKALGALTAVTMLIFKDSILGLVASVQLSTQRMVHKGRLD